MKHIQRGIVLLFIAVTAVWVYVYMTIVQKKDTVRPIITSETDTIEVSVNATDEELLKGLTATDDRDGDLTEQIRIGGHSKFITKGSCTLNYLVFDGSYNVGTYQRRINYTDYKSPVFSLEEPLIYEKNASVSVLSRIHATDDLDGQIDDKIKMTASNINSEKEGVYSVTLEVTNEYADVEEITLPVHVTEYGSLLDQMPRITLSDYLIYLGKGENFHPEDYLQEVTQADGSSGNTGEVRIEQNVQTAKEGVYEVCYRYTGSNGKTAVSYLVVVVNG